MREAVGEVAVAHKARIKGDPGFFQRRAEDAEAALLLLLAGVSSGMTFSSYVSMTRSVNSGQAPTTQVRLGASGRRVIRIAAGPRTTS
ncbi:hypothetical protein [Streptomyces sp. NBC_01235]|uniref:hypothetical protein n=1 Tax=Streptomyces sp. NBC_01235 TaxID=2903788 RepID=UPI002E1550E2|nr:hypothetical protein OG289_00515 [Streptomyces sp. NBC_01235]